MFSAVLLDRVKTRLGLPSRPSLDLAGLKKIYAAYSGHVPNDNIQKRIWLAGDKSRPVSGGEPTQFFENWLEHGTGGTCFPANGALCALLCALGFDAWRILGSVMMEGIEQDGNHGTVLVRIDDTFYLVDAQLAAFSALPLIAGGLLQPAREFTISAPFPAGKISTLCGIPARTVRHQCSRASILSADL